MASITPEREMIQGTAEAAVKCKGKELGSLCWGWHPEGMTHCSGEQKDLSGTPQSCFYVEEPEIIHVPTEQKLPCVQGRTGAGHAWYKASITATPDLPEGEESHNNESHQELDHQDGINLEQEAAHGRAAGSPLPTQLQAAPWSRGAQARAARFLWALAPYLPDEHPAHVPVIPAEGREHLRVPGVPAAAIAGARA